ncbi:MAG: Veg family protein [Clostridia bacterium]|nr:Veg family protein [Clostridia bacterium]
MIKQKGNILDTKDKIKNYYLKPVEVKVNLGRNKFVSYKGKVTSIYPALFTITPTSEYKGKTAFSYSEFMCGIVDIKELIE